jgi:hypothetical protein
MNALATAELAIMSEDIASPRGRDMVCSPRILDTSTPRLSSEQECNFSIATAHNSKILGLDTGFLVVDRRVAHDECGHQ